MHVGAWLRVSITLTVVCPWPQILDYVGPVEAEAIGQWCLGVIARKAKVLIQLCT